MKRLLFSMLLLAAPAVAAEQKPPEMVLLPRDVVEQVHQWLLAPNALNAVQLYGALQVCMADNPRNGMLMRSGPDQCPVVTEAISARDAEVAALRKQVETLTAEVAALRKQVETLTAEKAVREKETPADPAPVAKAP